MFSLDIRAIKALVSLSGKGKFLRALAQIRRLRRRDGCWRCSGGGKLNGIGAGPIDGL